jgi:hypothetical protein
MKKLTFILLPAMMIAGIATRTAAQINLAEVKITASTYKYLNSADNKEMSQPVRMLEAAAATYDVKKSYFYEDEYGVYKISFYLPNGQILAAYNKDGKLMHTAEKFKNTNLPEAVRDAITKRFPNWIISQDIYQLFYYEENNKVDKIFKVLLENGNKRMKVKLNEEGTFL